MITMRSANWNISQSSHNLLNILHERHRPEKIRTETSWSTCRTYLRKTRITVRSTNSDTSLWSAVLFKWQTGENTTGNYSARHTFAKNMYDIIYILYFIRATVSSADTTCDFVIIKYTNCWTVYNNVYLIANSVFIIVIDFACVRWFPGNSVGRIYRLCMPTKRFT